MFSDRRSTKKSSYEDVFLLIRFTQSVIALHSSYSLSLKEKDWDTEH